MKLQSYLLLVECLKWTIEIKCYHFIITIIYYQYCDIVIAKLSLYHRGQMKI